MIKSLKKPLDVLFVSPDSSAKAYQELAKKYAAIETPTWALLLAQACRSKGFEVDILDTGAERLTLAQSIKRIDEANPRLVCLTVYGQNPNSGTTNMIGAIALAQALKESYPEYKIAIVGSHVSALPLDVLAKECIDYVLLNEGVYALQNLLRSNLGDEVKKIKGIGHKLDGTPWLNPPEQVVPQERMDVDLPGYAWDLLPYNKKPLDLYRAHFWHAEFNHTKRTPFAAIYTSLGCRFACNFCMINIVNREDNGENINSSHSRNMRFWSPEFITREFEKLSNLGVETIRISDEMFFLDKRYYEPLLNNLINRELPLRMWAYSRIDTVRPKYLELFKKAGINWLAFDIDAVNQGVCREGPKGSFKYINIRQVIDEIQTAGINVIANYKYGLPNDNNHTMRQTLNLALDLNAEMANMSPCQALPGSLFYEEAKKNNWQLPDSYEGYAFLSYKSQPLPTKH
ncbi:MAG: B12-binding domain-containing radical SAM protein, partial [Verrucomicrobiales bacterium]|nr:B12-binding domain-containing radical SAM protein [Verrucomicrobiales bacterium]